MRITTPSERKITWFAKKRLTTKDKLILKAILAERDGRRCMICKREEVTVMLLTVDHLDGNTRNNELSNLQLAHATCNASAYQQTIKRALVGVVAENERDKTGIVPLSLNMNDKTELTKQLVDYGSGSIEMQVNNITEISFRNWLMAFIKSNSTILKKTAINAGAEETGCNPVTTRRYLDKLTSDKGPLEEYKNQFRQTSIRSKGTVSNE